MDQRWDEVGGGDSRQTQQGDGRTAQTRWSTEGQEGSLDTPPPAELETEDMKLTHTADKPAPLRSSPEPAEDRGGLGWSYATEDLKYIS